jgi:hypothetical protein
MRFVYILTAIILLYGCNNPAGEGEKYVDKFPREINLEFKEFQTPPVLFYISDMIVLDDVMVALDMKTDTFFHIFKLPSLDYCGGSTIHGNGPDDEISISPFIGRVDAHSFYYRSENHLKIASYNKATKKIVIKSQHALPPDFLNIFMMNGNVYGYNIFPIPTNREYLGFNLASKETFDFGHDFPSIHIPVPTTKLNMIFTRIMAGKPDGSRFAALYDRIPLLRIQDQNGKLIRDVWYSNKQRSLSVYMQDEPNPSDLMNITVNYQRINTTDKYIYGLYSGKTQEEIKQTDDYGFEIHVWDWDGQPIVRYILNQPVNSFTVSPDDSYIICSSFQHYDKLYKAEIQPDYQ